MDNGGEAEQTRSNSVCLMKCGPKAAFSFLGALHSWVILHSGNNSGLLVFYSWWEEH